MCERESTSRTPEAQRRKALLLSKEVRNGLAVAGACGSNLSLETRAWMHPYPCMHETLLYTNSQSNQNTSCGRMLCSRLVELPATTRAGPDRSVVIQSPALLVRWCRKATPRRFPGFFSAGLRQVTRATHCGEGWNRRIGVVDGWMDQWMDRSNDNRRRREKACVSHSERLGPLSLSHFFPTINLHTCACPL